MSAIYGGTRIWLVRDGKFQDALTDYSVATEHGAKSATLHWGAGMAYLGQNDAPHAREQFSMMASEGGDYEKNLAALGIDYVTFEGERMPYKSGTHGEHYRLIVEAMRQKLATATGKVLYAARKRIVEPVFGQTKGARGIRGFLLRGLEKVAAEWQLICLTHNLLKIWRRSNRAAVS